MSVISKPRKIQVATRLANEAFEPGGITAEEAVKRAEAAVETLRAPCREALDATLAEIEVRFGAGSDGRDGERFDDLYRLASTVIDLALGLPGSEIDEAARALCELADVTGIVGAWDWMAVDIHLEALRLLRERGAAMSRAERRLVLEGLAKVTRKRVGDPNALPGGGPACAVG